MDVFVTGASGWIGSASSAELLAAGHRVRGLARSERSAEALRAAGVEPVAGDLDTLDVLAAEARRADAVLHLGNKHDFDNQAEMNRTERAAVETFVTALDGTGKPFLLASGTAIPTSGPLTELMANPTSGPDAPRGGTENLALDHVGRGVGSVALRFAPTVHGPGDHGFVARLVEIAREHGAAGYEGDGSNRWTAVHRRDAARLVLLALERAEPGTIVHAVAEEAVTSRSIAEAIGAALGLPTVSVDPADVMSHFGWLGWIYGMDLPATAQLTRERFGWHPVEATLAEELAAGAYTS